MHVAKADVVACTAEGLGSFLLRAELRETFRRNSLSVVIHRDHKASSISELEIYSIVCSLRCSTAYLKVFSSKGCKIILMTGTSRCWVRNGK